MQPGMKPKIKPGMKPGMKPDSKVCKSLLSDLGVRQHLREQHDGRLRVVGVHEGHVEVVDEEDALLVASEVHK